MKTFKQTLCVPTIETETIELTLTDEMVDNSVNELIQKLMEESQDIYRKVKENNQIPREFFEEKGQELTQHIFNTLLNNLIKQDLRIESEFGVINLNDN